MLASPRIVAIDNDCSHLKVLVTGLNRFGVGCLPVHFTENLDDLQACPNLRVLFADLHLVESSDNDRVHFANLAGLIETTFKPTGPYLIVLWTAYPSKAEELHRYVRDELCGVPKPFDVIALKKEDYREGADGWNIGKLLEDIERLSQESPAFSALVDWEERVIEAAGDTVSSLMDIAMSEVGNDTSENVAGLLHKLAVAAVGANNVASDRFRAVNEALLPILSDRVSALRTNDNSRNVWDKALSGADGSVGNSEGAVAKLNQMLHIDKEQNTIEAVSRGAVIPFARTLTRADFIDQFGLDETVAAKEQFRCSSFQNNCSDFRWILVHVRASCDQAQDKPGTFSYYLGMDAKADKLSKSSSGKLSGAVWESPNFEIEGEVRRLRVHALFQIALTKGRVERHPPVYRLREQLLAELTHHIHSHGSRPGIISFR